MDFTSGDWSSIIGSGIGALGSIGGGIVAGGNSSDGFSQKGAYQKARFDYRSAPLRARAFLRYAKEAGLHPLALLGSGGLSSTQVISGDQGFANDYGIADAMRQIGQDISSAQDRAADRDMRDLNYLIRLEDVKGRDLENQILQEQLRILRNPPAPKDQHGKGVTQPLFEYEPKRVPAEGNIGTEVGHAAATQWFNLEGAYFKGMSERFADASEEDFAAKARYWSKMLQSEVAPYQPPKHIKLPKGYWWVWRKGVGYKPQKVKMGRTPNYSGRRKKRDNYLKMGEMGF